MERPTRPKVTINREAIDSMPKLTEFERDCLVFGAERAIKMAIEKGKITIERKKK